MGQFKGREREKLEWVVYRFEGSWEVGRGGTEWRVSGKGGYILGEGTVEVEIFAKFFEDGLTLGETGEDCLGFDNVILGRKTEGSQRVRLYCFRQC